MRYALGVKENGEKYALRDPREEEIAALIKGVGAAGSIVDRLLGLPGLFPEELARSDKWQGAVKSRLELMLAKDMRAAIAAEADKIASRLCKVGDWRNRRRQRPSPRSPGEDAGRQMRGGANLQSL